MKTTTKTFAAAVLAMTMALTGCGDKTSSTASAPTANSVSSASSAGSAASSNADSAASSANSEVSSDSAVSSADSAASSSESAASTPGSGVWANAQYTEDTELGEGAHSIKLEVKADNKSVTLTVKSDNDNLEKILTENKLVEGDESEFGLYIKKVIGIQADYDADGAYWALCKDGEMTPTGANGITIADGDHYELVYTPADSSAAAA